jgi:hypothetical protein
MAQTLGIAQMPHSEGNDISALRLLTLLVSDLPYTFLIGLSH